MQLHNTSTVAASPNCIAASLRRILHACFAVVGIAVAPLDVPKGEPHRADKVQPKSCWMLVSTTRNRRSRRNFQPLFPLSNGEENEPSDLETFEWGARPVGPTVSSKGSNKALLT